MANKAGEETQRKILRAAEKMFVEHGFNGASLSTIAKVAKVNQSLISHHFGSKSALWNAVCSAAFERYFNQQLELLCPQNNTPVSGGPADENGAAVLTQSIASHFDFLTSTPEAFRLFAWSFLDRNRPDASAPVQEVIATGLAALRAGQKSGALRDDIPAAMIWAQFIGAAYGWILLRDQFQDQIQQDVGTNENLDSQFLQSFLSVFLKGVQPNP